MNEKEKESFQEFLRILGYLALTGLFVVAIAAMLPGDLGRIVNSIFPGAHIQMNGGQQLWVAFFFVLLFLIIREILTWYWKLNRIVTLLEKIEKNTRPTNTDI